MPIDKQMQKRKRGNTMDRKKALTVIAILGIIILALAAVAVVQGWNDLPSKVTGTYCMDNVIPQQTVYLSLQHDGRFQVFNPLREMYSGTYKEDPGMITDKEYMYLALYLEDGTKGYAIFDRHDRVILDRSVMTNLPEQLRPFIRISDVPALFTMTSPE